MIVAVLFAANILGAPRQLAAQPVPPANQSPPADQRWRLADYVPASTSFFLHIMRLDEMDAAMRRAHAYRLLPILAGATKGLTPSMDVKRILGDFLGETGDIPVDELMTMELGIVAPSWRELGSAVWLVRVDDPATTRRWFPNAPEKREGVPAKAFSTGSGLIVSTAGDLVGMARSRGAGKLLSIMSGRNQSTLGQDKVYEELVSYLPGRPVAVAYVRNQTEPVGGETAGASSASLDRAVVGLYEGAGRIDFAVRAAVSKAIPKVTLSDDAISRFARLPQSTLFASALSVDMTVAPTSVDLHSGDLIGRLSMLLTILRSRSAATLSTSLGPHLIVAWDQDLRPASTSPQVALMIQTTDATAVVRDVSALAEGLAPILLGADMSKEQDAPTVKRAAHLGRVIHYLPLAESVSSSDGPRASLLAALEPAWADLDGWFVIALSRDHIERLFEARHGLTRTLAEVPDVSDLLSGRAKRRHLAILQADLAADVLWQWLSDLDGGKPSLLDPAMWSAANESSASTRRLGVAMRTRQIPGKVVVVRVYPDTAAAGVLQPGDRIVGINDRLLDLESPNASLREQWELARHTTSPVFRVERDGALIEVVLTRSPLQRPTFPIEPAQAIRELASLAQGLEFASFSSFASQPDRYSARLSLRLPEEQR